MDLGSYRLLFSQTKKRRDRWTLLTFTTGCRYRDNSQATKFMSGFTRSAHTRGSLKRRITSRAEESNGLCCAAHACIGRDHREDGFGTDRKDRGPACEGKGRRRTNLLPRRWRERGQLLPCRE